MQFYTKVSMKDLLSQGLYLIMMEKSFDSITIKQICNKTGVNRGTFYNHFIDKYEALEYLSHKIILDSNIEEGKDQDYVELIKKIIITFQDNKEFFYRAFQVKGQNSFESMLINIFHDLFDMYFIQNDIVLEHTVISKNYIIDYLSSCFLFIINDWIQHNYNKSDDEVLEIILYLFSHSFGSLVEHK